MTSKSLIEIFERDLNRLITEINLYKTEESIWQIKDGISNSAGNLCLHLVGNLNQYIGATLGNTGYIRNRNLEFSTSNIPRKEIIDSIEKTKAIILEVLQKIDKDDFEKTFPIDVFQTTSTIGFMLIHLTTHLTYHLGQINYHRRITT